MPGGGQFQTSQQRVTKTTPNVSTSTTVSAAEPIPTVVNSGLQNVLNKYRSSTYIFTLAGLKNKYLQNPDLYRSSTLENVILRSGGKGTGGITVPNSDAVEQAAQAQREYDSESISQSATSESLSRAKNKLDKANQASSVFNQATAVIPGFNDSSPGRFDMFIQNVEINSMFGFTELSSVSLVNSFKFEVIEPYSLNGFIEALHVTALASGYPNYLQAAFVLKVEFVGYPDDVDLPQPELIPNTERYFPFKFTGIEVEVTERGTKYSCTGIPVNERDGFGQSNKLKKPTNMTGAKVGDILKDLMRNVTEQQKLTDDKSKATTAVAANHDSFEIKFPVWGPNGLDFSQENEIASSDVIAQLKDSAVYKFEDPANTNKKNALQNKVTGRGQSRATPAAANTKPQIQFNEGAMLTNIIAAVIRDSAYTKKLIKEIKPDEYGYIDYFLIRTQSVNKDAYDEVTRRHYQEITFVVVPHKVHYKRIPGYGATQISEMKLKVLALREYNYIYTGKNIDVLNFKINFNSLFYEAVPLAMGNTDQPNRKYGVTAEGTAEVKANGDSRRDVENSSMGVAPMYADTETSRVQQDGGSGNQRQDDPYAAMAKAMHKAITESKTSMIQADLEILGDPFYLVTGGIGNYNPAPGDNLSIFKNGEVNHSYREVLVTVNFRNPIDINQKGFHEFDPKRVPWSGIYRVNEVTHVFNDGLFKQTLKLMRVPGQILGDSTKETPIENKFKITPKMLDTPITPTTVGVDAGRPTEANLLLQQQRGLPSPGLPGVLSNFTSALGGLGGSVTSLLNQVSGAVTNGIGKLTSAAGVFGGSIPGGVDQLASGIRLQASGITSLVTQKLGSASLVNQAGNTLQSSFPIDNAAQGLASNIVSRASSIVNSISTPGSGIGAGATVLVDAASSALPSANGTITAADVRSITSQLPTSVQSFAGISSNLKPTDIFNVQSIGSSAADLVNGVGSKVSGLTSGISTDPLSIANKFGINASQLSGLSDNLQSKVLGQISDIAKTVPDNVNLGQAINQGLVLDYIPKDKFANIPPTAPFRTAPSAEVNVQDLASIASVGGSNAIAKAFGVSDISKVSGSLLPPSIENNILASVTAGVNNPLAGLSKQFNLTDSTAIGGKLLSANSQIGSITGVSGSVESQLNSVKAIVGNTLNNGTNLALSVTSQFGSSSLDTSPLKKLIGG